MVAVSLFGPERSESQTFRHSSNIPNFWDPNIRIPKPEGFKIDRLRFLTTTDFPPFNFIDRNRLLSGFHVDLARQICSELAILQLCQIQALPWDELDKAIENGEGEAIIAGLEMTNAQRKKYDFSMPFLHIPARFVALRDSGLSEPMASSLFKKKTALIKGSSHAHYFKDIFSNRQFVEFVSFANAKKALIDKSVDALFGDAVSLSFWLTSQSNSNCCRFVGGPYLSIEYLGNGMTIAVAKNQPKLVEAINYALRRINDNGTFRELYLRYFPLSLY
ncbi:MAG: transporter substrate-binding domain-containing protein [Hyphomicrobiales bacterium]|nr:transporter substrate-binding domain-containing protein [Hyphomicrobiales bacterium]